MKESFAQRYAHKYVEKLDRPLTEDDIARAYARQLRIGRHTVVEMLKNAQFVHREMQRFNKFLQKMKKKGAVL